MPSLARGSAWGALTVPFPLWSGCSGSGLPPPVLVPRERLPGLGWSVDQRSPPGGWTSAQLNLVSLVGDARGASRPDPMGGLLRQGAPPSPNLGGGAPGGAGVDELLARASLGRGAAARARWVLEGLVKAPATARARRAADSMRCAAEVLYDAADALEGHGECGGLREGCLVGPGGERSSVPDVRMVPGPSSPRWGAATPMSPWVWKGSQPVNANSGTRRAMVRKQQSP